MANPQTWTDPNTGDVYELIPDAPEAQAPKTWTDPKTGDTYELIPDNETAASPAPKARTLEAPAEQTVASLAFKNNPEAAAAAQSLWDAGVRNPEAFNTALRSKFPQFSGKVVTFADIAAARKRDAFYKARGQKNPGNFLFTESTGIADPVAPTDVFSAALQGGKKSLESMANSATGLAALAADTVGADETGDYLLNKYIEDQAKIQFNNPSAVESVQDIGGVGDAAMYAAETLGGLVPQITSSMGVGALGAKLGGRAGAAVGAMANTSAQETGSIYGDTYRETGVKAPVSSVLAGLAAGSLDAITPFRALGRLGVPAEVITNKLSKRIVKTGAKDLLVEGGTEAAQTFIEGLPEAVVTGKSPFTEEMLDRMVDAFARGAIGGGAIGAGTEALRPNGSLPPQEAEFAETTTNPQPEPTPVEESDAPLPFEAPDFLQTPAKTPFKQTPAFLNESAKPKGRAKPVETTVPANEAAAPLAVNKQQASDHINDVIASDWKNAPPITTVESLDELPEDVRQNVIDDGAQDAKGITVNGQVYILAHNLKDLDDLAGVTYHEALGHAGLGMQFGKRLNTVLEQMYNTNQMIREAADAWLAANTTQSESPIAHAVEEILAETSEGGKVDAKVMDKIKAFLKQYARRVPGLKNLKYTDKEVIAILSMANNKVISGNGSAASGNGNRYIRTYHGTPHDFDQFDHSKMGTGEGNQSYGWGTYVAENRAVAETYKEMLSPSFERSKDGKKTKLYYSATDVTKLFERLPSLTPNEKTNIYWVLNRMWDKNMSVDEAVEATIEARGREDGLRKAGKILNDAGIKKSNKGKLLEVELPDDALWFDFDKTLKEQPDLFKALKKAEELDVYTWDEWQNRIDQVERMLWTGDEKDTAAAWEIFNHLQNSVIHDEMQGRDAHNAISKAFMYEDKEVSEFLKSLGIAGNKYLDGYSRDSKEGTSNYVVFDDKTPKIVNKYSKPDNSDRPRGLRWDKLEGRNNNFLKPFFKEMQKDIPEKNRQSWEETERLAEQMGMNYEKAKKLNRGPETEEIEAVRMWAVGKGNLLEELGKKIREGTATGREKDQYVLHLKQLVDILDVFSEFATKQGRGLNILQKVSVNNKKAVNNIRYMLNRNGDTVLDDDTRTKLLLNAVEDLQKTTGETLKRGHSKAYGFIMNALNLPRTVMSSFDFSAPLRQGIFLVGRKEFYSNLGRMFKAFGSERVYQEMMESIKARPSYPLMKNSGLYVSDLDHSFTAREEAFMSQWAEKIPGLGKVIRASERAYSGFLNMLRADTFDTLVTKFNEANPESEFDDKRLSDLAGFINNATGRGKMLQDLEAAAPMLNALFFSPRLIASRVNLLNPAYYVKLDPMVRKEAVKSLIAFGTIAATIAGLFAANDDWDVEVDPRSSDFMKLRTGDTRYDILGGFGQYITLGARLATNKTKTTLGEVKELGKQLGDKNRLDVLLTFLENKGSPVTTYVMDYLRGKNAVGESFDDTWKVPATEVSPSFELRKAEISRFIPLFLQDAAELMAEKGASTGAAMAAPALFGIGVQNYSDRNGGTTLKDRYSDDPTAQEIQRLAGDKKIISSGNRDDAKRHGVPNMTDEQLKQYRDYSAQLILAATKEAMATEEWQESSDEERKDWLKEIGTDMRAMAREDLFGPIEEEGQEEDAGDD